MADWIIHRMDGLVFCFPDIVSFFIVFGGGGSLKSTHNVCTQLLLIFVSTWREIKGARKRENNETDKHSLTREAYAKMCMPCRGQKREIRTYTYNHRIRSHILKHCDCLHSFGSVNSVYEILHRTQWTNSFSLPLIRSTIFQSRHTIYTLHAHTHILMQFAHEHYRRSTGRSLKMYIYELRAYSQSLCVHTNTHTLMHRVCTMAHHEWNFLPKIPKK